MRLALAQINTVVGDLDGNRDADPRAPRRGARARAPTSSSSPSSPSPATRPRTCCCGPGFVRAAERVARARSRARHAASPRSSARRYFDRDLYNACAVCAGGEVKAVYRKRFLPNYGVFDEDRYFAPGRDLVLLEHRRDADRADGLRGHLAAGPARDRPRARRRGAGRRTSPRRRSTSARSASARRCSRRARATTPASSRSATPVGGQDELIFDGHSRRARRRGRGARARARVRGGAARRRRRPGGRDRPAAARRAPPRARARSASRRDVPVVAASARRAADREPPHGGADRAVSRRARADAARARARPRATTCARTASATSSSASPAASTRR